MSTVAAAMLGLAAASILLTGCVDPGSGPTPSPTVSVTKSATPTPTPTHTSTPTETPTDPPSTPTPSPPPVTTANVQIVNTRYDPAGRTLSAAAMITNVISATGTCTLTATQGDLSATAQAPAVPDASVTYCGDLTVVLPEGASGSWTATVDYDDGTAAGSASMEVMAQ
ncbi:hypothetical protein [Herbiconiux ginsengi]|uniref:hypothetical protein n=1 Tax=Herbiconiux ginsengi TaxID=381665 RepID=UPI00111499E3|nr:hypothetical protein [Herbiconiux ginsengi]